MNTRILFPYRIGDDNRNAFSFTIEMARRSNLDIIALTSVELSLHPTQYNDRLVSSIRKIKDEIYCNLLEMKGYYHGRFNQWKNFGEVKIHVQLINNELNIGICNAIKDHADLIIVLQYKYFSDSDLYEEIFSHSLKDHVSFFILPVDKKFYEPSPNLIGLMFHQQKRSAFMKLLQDTKIFDLPEDFDEFRKEMIFRQAV